MNGRDPKNNKIQPPPAPERTERSQRRAEQRKLRNERQAELLAAGAKPLPEGKDIEKIMLGPLYAYQLLEHNKENRPLNHPHIERIAAQIKTGKWHYNGDTIKMSEDNDILDGQHRLWAIVEANTAVQTVIVRGIQMDAFATIDAIRRPRNGADTIALTGQHAYRQQIAMALTWLLRWQRGILETYKTPENRIENSDILAAFEDHPGITRAVEVATKARSIANTSIIAFAYYVMSNQNSDIAELLIHTLLNPAGTSINHPFYRLRAYFLTDRQVKKDPIHSIALIFKAANFVAKDRESLSLSWRSQGQSPEPFPKLDLTDKPAPTKKVRRAG